MPNIEIRLHLKTDVKVWQILSDFHGKRCIDEIKKIINKSLELEAMKINKGVTIKHWAVYRTKEMPNKCLRDLVHSKSQRLILFTHYRLSDDIKNQIWEE